MAIGGIAGFAVTFFLLEYVEGIGETGLSLSAEIAAIIGGFYILISLFVGGGTLAPKAGARLLNVEDEEELMEQRSVLLLSSVALAVWGAALLVLALSGEDAVFAPVPATVTAIALYAVGTYFAVLSYRKGDELMTAVNREAASLSYFFVLVVVGGWSALAHGGLLPVPAPLDILSLFYALVMIATFVAAGKRGMLAVK
jgi:hypothetical protein